MERTKVRNGVVWARITAELIGWPVLVVLACKFVAGMAFTLTCQTAGWRCEYSITSPGQMFGVVSSVTEAPKEPTATASELADVKEQVQVLTSAMHRVADEVGLLEPVPKQKGK